MNPIAVNQICLDVLAPGQSAYIAGVESRDGVRRRLQELGFTPGAPITCLMRAPSGDPTAYRIRSAVIALRREDAEKVRLSLRKEADGHDG